MFEINQQVRATDAEGRFARGTIVSIARGVGGGVLYYGVENPVTGWVDQVFPGTWEIHPA